MLKDGALSIDYIFARHSVSSPSLHPLISVQVLAIECTFSISVRTHKSRRGERMAVEREI